MMVQGPRIAIRTDASLAIGSGHVMRCLTLAELLRADGWECHFLCRELPGNLIGLLLDRGFECHNLPMPDDVIDDLSSQHSAWLTVAQSTDAGACREILDRVQPDWLIVDHYALDHHWERAAAPDQTRVMVIDDLADRGHDCDVLLDQTYGRDRLCYNGLIPDNCLCLTGTKFALLRPEFAALRPESLARRAAGTLNHILVFMGGVDRNNATGAVLDAIAAAPVITNLRLSVVLGPNAPFATAVHKHAAGMPLPTEVLINTPEIARVMAAADLAIGAGGSASWERCCLGLPTLLVVLADNQRANAEALHTQDAAHILGPVDDGFPTRLSAALYEMTAPGRLRHTAQAAANLVDGMGAPRVAKLLLEGIQN